MSKDDVIQMTGRVIKALPSANFQVEVEAENSSKKIITAHISGKMRMKFIRVLPGDQVTVEFSPYDLTKGRIIFRLK